MKNNKKIILITLIGLLVLGLGGFGVFSLINKDSNKTNPSNKPNEETPVVEQAESINELLTQAPWKDELIKKANKKGAYDKEPDVVVETKGNYGETQKEVTVRLEFTKLSESRDDALDLIKFYNESSKGNFFTDVNLHDTADYDVYKAKVVYGDKTIVDEFPQFVEILPGDREIVIDDIFYTIAPWILASEKTDDGFIYVLGLMRPIEEKEICLQYSAFGTGELQTICLNNNK